MKVDPENGMFLGADDCHYDTEWQARLSFFDVCGCGDQEGLYNFFRELLFHIDHRQSNRWAQGALADFVAANSEIAAEAILQMLPLAVADHGTSVRGSWLEDVGKEVVDNPPVSYPVPA